MKDALLDKIKIKNPEADIDLIDKAYEYSKEAHKHQLRKCGTKPYFVHLYAVVELLIEYDASTEAICAAFLHDTVEDTEVSIEDVKKEFGETIAFIVEGCTKIEIKGNRKLAKKKSQQKIMEHGVKDKKVLIIKVCDRLHNSHSIHNIEAEYQELFAREALDFYVPLAESLGMKKAAEKIRENAEKHLKKLDKL